MRKHGSWWLAVSMALYMLQAQAVTVQDDAQQAVDIKTPVRRVFSLLPSLT